MSDPADPKTRAPVTIRLRRPRRLVSIFSIALSCLLFAFAGGCFVMNLIIRPKVMDSPQGATEVAVRNLDWTLPPGFEGKSATTIDSAFLRIDVAKFIHRQGRGFLVIGQLQSKWYLLPDQQAQTQNFVDRFSPELRKIHIDQSETRKRVIHGLPAEFQVATGEDRASTTRYRQVTGTFRGKFDDILLTLQCEENVLTEAEIEDFLNSIH